MLSEMEIKGTKELEFVIFCVESVAAELGKNAEQVYNILAENNIIHGYIVPEYEVLHTQSKEYIVEDIIEVMKERGVEV